MNRLSGAEGTVSCSNTPETGLMCSWSYFNIDPVFKFSVVATDKDKWAVTYSCRDDIFKGWRYDSLAISTNVNQAILLLKFEIEKCDKTFQNPFIFLLLSFLGG